MKKYGVIIRRIRKENALTIKDFSHLIGRSTGWISGVENSSEAYNITRLEFERILQICTNTYGDMAVPQCGRVALRRGRNRLDGAILKHLRKRKGISLKQLAGEAHLSSSYLSRLENGKREVCLNTRNKILNALGYSPSTFKNFSTGDKRSKSVPTSYKIKAILECMSEMQREELLESAHKILRPHLNL